MTAQVDGYRCWALSGLHEIIGPKRDENPCGVVYLIDHYFINTDLISRLPIRPRPGHLRGYNSRASTRSVDALKHEILVNYDQQAYCHLGIGGGSTLDSAKAVSNLLTNPGPSANYQGWDLVKKPGIFKVGIPTLAGTGAEASRTCVLTNYETGVKLGMNSNFTLFDYLILDPSLLVPYRAQYFYTGMDTYIHCVESLEGNIRHAAADECRTSSRACP